MKNILDCVEYPDVDFLSFFCFVFLQPTVERQRTHCSESVATDARTRGGAVARRERAVPRSARDGVAAAHWRSPRAQPLRPRVQIRRGLVRGGRAPPPVRHALPNRSRTRRSPAAAAGAPLAGASASVPVVNLTSPSAIASSWLILALSMAPSAHGGYPLAPPPVAVVRTVNVLSAPIVMNSARPRVPIRAFQMQSPATALRLQSPRVEAVLVQPVTGGPGVVLPNNPIVRVMPGVSVAASLPHLAGGVVLSGIRPAMSLTCIARPPNGNVLSTATATPATTAAAEPVASAPLGQSARDSSVKQRRSMRTSDDVSRESLPKPEICPLDAVHLIEVKQKVQFVISIRSSFLTDSKTLEEFINQILNCFWFLIAGNSSWCAGS